MTAHTTYKGPDGRTVHTFEDTPEGREALRTHLRKTYGDVIEFRPRGLGVDVSVPRLDTGEKITVVDRGGEWFATVNVSIGGYPSIDHHSRGKTSDLAVERLRHYVASLRAREHDAAPLRVGHEVEFVSGSLAAINAGRQLVVTDTNVVNGERMVRINDSGTWWVETTFRRVSPSLDRQPPQGTGG